MYGRDKKAYKLRAKNVVMANWNMTIPYMVPELPAKQKEALLYGVKVPLCYIAIEIANWTAFKKMGIRNVACPACTRRVLIWNCPPISATIARRSRRKIRSWCEPGKNHASRGYQRGISSAPDTRNFWRLRFRPSSGISAINSRVRWDRGIRPCP